MPPSAYYQTERFNGSHKHHIFYGSNRKNSEKYGLFVFLRPELHNLTDKGVHFNKEFDLLRFGNNYNINIELKSETTTEDQQNQLKKNHFYLFI